MVLAGLATPVRRPSALGPVVPGLVSPGLVLGDRVARDVTQMRPLPRVLFGVTADDIGHLRELVTSARHLPEMPTTRMYFDVSEPPRHYATAVRPAPPG